MHQEFKKKPVTLLVALPAPAGTTLLRTYHRLHSSLYIKPRIRAPGLFYYYYLPLKMGPTSCPEMLVSDYHCSLRNNSEELEYET